MRKILIAALAACALVVAAPAGATLKIAPYDPTGQCTVNTFQNGVLHLEKTCATTADAAAGADILGFEGQTFTSASFTLASASQCNGGSPRFDILDANGNVYFLGCNNVTPTTNANGTVTYTFTAADIARINPTLPAMTTIKAVDVALDVQGAADISRIVFNGVWQLPAGVGPWSKSLCKHHGWKSFGFRNQGACVSWFEHHNAKGHDDDHESQGEHAKQHHS